VCRIAVFFFVAIPSLHLRGRLEHSGIAAAAMTAAMDPHFSASRMEVVNNISPLARSIYVK
jgi:hypothetical protein